MTRLIGMEHPQSLMDGWIKKWCMYLGMYMIDEYYLSHMAGVYNQA